MHYAAGGYDATAGGMSRSAKPTGQLGIRVDLCGRPPLTHELAHRRVGVELGGGGGYAGKLLDKRAPIYNGQELEPRKRVTKRIRERPGVVDSQVTQCAAEGSERGRPLRLPVRSCQPQVGFVAAPKDDIPLIHLERDILRMSEEVRERPFCNSHGWTISEVVLKYPVAAAIGGAFAGAGSHSDPIGAGDETRTRDIQLGRLALYQLSYSRKGTHGTAGHGYGVARRSWKPGLTPR
jgi:hypothetical protein